MVTHQHKVANVTQEQRTPEEELSTVKECLAKLNDMCAV